jgi:hypothetical protein
MKRSTFSEEQIVYAIRQAEAGTPVGDLCRQLGVSDATLLVSMSVNTSPHAAYSGERLSPQRQSRLGFLPRSTLDLGLAARWA